VALISMLSLVLACGSPAGPAPTAPDDSAVQFVDAAAEAGLDLVTLCGNPGKDHILGSIGTGVAVADYDGDGDEDIYLPTAQLVQDWVSGRNPQANALYRNDGDGRFTDVAESAGVNLRTWSSGAYFVDYDNDGDKDLFVTAYGPNVLFRNEGDGKFQDVAFQAGVAGDPTASSTSAAFGDLDGDGDLDLFVVNYVLYDLRDPPAGGKRTIWRGVEVYRGPQGLIGQPDALYRNNDDGTFSDITETAGLGDYIQQPYGLGVEMADFDDDGDLDIYVANDSVVNHLYRNDGNLKFVEVATMAGVATNEDASEQAGMGTDAADYNGDGLLDLFVTNFSHEWNTLYRHLGNLVFVDATFEAKLQDSYLKLAWGTKFFDYDHDGWLDLFVACGHAYPGVDDHPALNTSYAQTNVLYRNNGDGTFENRSESAGSGLQLVDSSRGVAMTDIDRDGDLDIVVSNNDGRPNLLYNQGGNRKSWVSFHLTGVRSNRDAIGAILTLRAGGKTLLRGVNPFGSYQSQGSFAVHFGLEDAETIEGVTVTWPSGEIEELGELAARKFYAVTEGEGVTAVSEPQP